MKTLTIRRRIIASFAVVLALIVLMAAVAHNRLEEIERQAGLIGSDSVPGLTNNDQIVVNQIANYSLTLEFALQTDTAAKQKLQTDIQASRVRLDMLLAEDAASILSPAERSLFELYRIADRNYRSVQDGIMKAGLDAKTRRDESINRMSTELDPAFAKIQATLGVLEDFNKAEADESVRRIVASVAGARAVVLMTVGLGLAVALVCGYFLLQSITQPLGRLVTVLDAMRTGDLSGRLRVDRVDEFGSVATGFNRMTDDLAGLVGQVQESGLQVNASVTGSRPRPEQQATASGLRHHPDRCDIAEISVTSKNLVGTMNDVATVAEQSAVLAGLGQTGLTHMEETMRRVLDAAGSINAKLAVLSTKAGNISLIVTTITRVADQTNLLSLNAAIEAEKAGEYGRGFAVVATEIRRLADQTAVATYDIDQMVKEIQSAVAAGVMGMDKFSEEVRRGMEEVQRVGGQLSQVILQVQALAPRIESVNDGMEAQASGAEQITQALAQLSEAAQQAVDSLRQSGGRSTN